MLRTRNVRPARQQPSVHGRFYARRGLSPVEIIRPRTKFIRILTVGDRPPTYYPYTDDRSSSAHGVNIVV